jgi:hypothetical protein
VNDLDLRFDAAAVAEAVRQPPLDRLRTRAARRRNRRLAGSSALAMLVTAVVLPVALGRGGGRHTATPEPVPEPPAPAFAQLWVGAGGAMAGVSYPVGDCMPSVALTEDGGTSWTSSGRVTDLSCPQPDEGVPLVELAVLAPHTYALHVPDRWLITRDAGRTWADLLTTVTDVDAFPPAAVPLACGGCLPTLRPMAVDPATGEVFKLAHDLPVIYLPHAVSTGADGALWAVAAVANPPGGQGFAESVIRSTDRGRTWSVTATTGGAQPFTVVARSATDAYALTHDGRSARVYRTGDGGATWTPASELPVDADPLSFAAGPDGILGVLARGGAPAGVRLWTSSDGGDTFGPGPALTGAVVGPAATDGAGRWVVVADGVAWRTTGGAWERLGPVP